MRVIARLAALVDQYVALFVVVGLIGLTGLGLAVDHLANRLSQTERESTQQRVVTVTQRCDLTDKILEVLVKDDPTRVAAFHVSYAACEKQLRIVKRIAAHAP